jgi:hypothetical protein
VRLALPDPLVPPAPRALKASKDRSAPRGPSASRGHLALPDRPDRSDRRARRGKPVAKAQSALQANADHQGRKAPLAHPAPPDQLARRVTPVRHQQFAWSPVRIAFAAETTKSLPVLFAQVVRSTERSARRLARQQPVYVYVGDLGQRLATAALVIALAHVWCGRQLVRDLWPLAFDHGSRLLRDLDALDIEHVFYEGA